MKLLFIVAWALAYVNAGILLKTKYHGSLNRNEMVTVRGRRVENLQAAPEQWFDQKVDHFNPQDSRTFKQRYYANNTFFDGNGPIFVVLGGEGPAGNTSVSRFIVSQYAQELKGMVVAFEHRHYGKSVPFGSLSQESLKYLSSQQALADYAVLREQIRKQYNIGSANKWVAVGGSYSGNLAAWIRNKYPHLFDMALGTSAPVKATVNFPEYMRVVQASLGDSCANVVRKATDELEQLVKTTDGRTKVSQMFKVCEGVGSLDDDISTFFSGIADPICGVVQYNDDNNSLGNLMNIPQLCAYMKPEAPLQSYANFINAYYNKTQQECTTGKYTSYLSKLKNEKIYPENDDAAGRAWTYQTCAEFGYYQSAEGSDQPFSKYISLAWFLDQCSSLFGIKNVQDNVDWTNQYYGELQIAATKTIFPNGSIDPWHALGLLLSSKVDSKYIHFMKGTAHCADLYLPRDSDLPDLKSTRAATLAQLKEWISE